MNYQDLINAELEATNVDMNQASQGFERIILETGQYLGAIVAYVDLGDQEERYKNEAKGVGPCVRLEVAVFPVGEDGTMATEPVLIPEREMFIKNNERAKSFRAFQALNYQNDPKFRHFAQAFMRPYLFTVTKRVSKTTNRPYNTIDWAKTQPAVDPMTRKPYTLPEVDDRFKVVFLWNNPTQEMWDKLYIEGEMEDGSSKNFIQEQIVNAKNFHGSAVDLMLRSGGKPIPNPIAAAPAEPEQPVEQPTEQPEEAAPVAPVSPVSPALPTMPTEAA